MSASESLDHAPRRESAPRLASLPPSRRLAATVAIEVTYTNGTGLVSNSKGLLTKHRYPASPGCGPVLSKADTLREQRAEKQTAEAPGDDESHEGDEESRQESDSNVVRVRPTEESGEVFMINTREFAHGMSFGVRSTGHGVGVGPMTGERTEVHPTTVFSGKDLGISAPAEGLWEITDVWFMEKNKQVHEAGLPQVVKHHDDYRRWLMAGRKKDQSVLTSAFWFFVFDNDQADWGFVEWYFANVESNPEVQELRPKHGEGIAAMIKRRNYVRTTPAVAFWYQVFR